jgi:hypothetical protein
LSIWECHVFAITFAMLFAILVAIILATPSPFCALSARFASAVAFLDDALALSLLSGIDERLRAIIERDQLPALKYLGHLRPVDVAHYSP